MGLVLLGKEERPKCVRNRVKLRQKCVKNARNTFGGEHLLDDTEFLGHPGPRCRDIPDRNFMQVAFLCCFRQGVARMSRDLGRDVPDLEKLYARKLWADFSYPTNILQSPGEVATRNCTKDPPPFPRGTKQRCFHCEILEVGGGPNI